MNEPQQAVADAFNRLMDALKSADESGLAATKEAVKRFERIINARRRDLFGMSESAFQRMLPLPYSRLLFGSDAVGDLNLTQLVRLMHFLGCGLHDVAYVFGFVDDWPKATEDQNE